MTADVTLRPPAEDDLPVIEKLTWGPEIPGEFNYYGWGNPLHWRTAWAENRLLGSDMSLLMVVQGEERLGFVNWRRRTVGPASFHFELGIALLPAARGLGYGTAAHRMLVEYLFAHTPVHRIEASTETGNLAERRALEKAGFTREGVQRGIGWRAGARRDGVTYSILRTDPRP